MYRYSLTQWIVGNEPIENTLDRLKACGYDGVEFTADPYQDIDVLKRLLAESGLCCTSLCGMFSRERDLASEDAAIRENAQKYLRDCVDIDRKSTRLNSSH